MTQKWLKLAINGSNMALKAINGSNLLKMAQKWLKNGFSEIMALKYKIGGPKSLKKSKSQKVKKKSHYFSNIIFKKPFLSHF